MQVVIGNEVDMFNTLSSDHPAQSEHAERASQIMLERSQASLDDQMVVDYQTHLLANSLDRSFPVFNGSTQHLSSYHTINPENPLLTPINNSDRAKRRMKLEQKHLLNKKQYLSSMKFV